MHEEAMPTDGETGLQVLGREERAEKVVQGSKESIYGEDALKHLCDALGLHHSDYPHEDIYFYADQDIAAYIAFKSFLMLTKKQKGY